MASIIAKSVFCFKKMTIGYAPGCAKTKYHHLVLLVSGRKEIFIWQSIHTAVKHDGIYNAIV